MPHATPGPAVAVRPIRTEADYDAALALEPYIGGRGRVSEVLGRKRALTLPMIRRLAAGLAIPAGLLVGGAPPPTGQAR